MADIFDYAKDYPKIRTPNGAVVEVQASCISKNVRILRKGLQGTNTFTYYAKAWTNVC